MHTICIDWGGSCTGPNQPKGTGRMSYKRTLAEYMLE